jgi:hypothetical protein
VHLTAFTGKERANIEWKRESLLVHWGLGISERVMLVADCDRELKHKDDGSNQP